MELSTLVILIFIVCVILFCAVYMHEEDEPIIVEYTHIKEVEVPVVKTVYVDRASPDPQTSTLNNQANPSTPAPDKPINPADYVDKIL
jgi:hypothetical protein